MAESKPPPASGTFGYNTFVPPVGPTMYPDPVFGGVVVRLTDDHARDDIYGRNMLWSADGRRYLHRTNAVLGKPDAWNVIDAARGAPSHVAIGFGTLAADGGFDPLDPDALFALNNRAIERITLRADGSWARAPYLTLPAPLLTLGGSINWLSTDGRVLLARCGGEPSVRVYDRQTLDVPYAGAIDARPYVERGGYLGVSPDGNFVVGFEGGAVGASGVGRAVSWPIDHARRALASAPTICWSLCGDHGAFASCSDGRTYFVSYNCYGHAGLWRADVTQNADGLDEAAQMALPHARELIAFETWNDFGHVTTVATGARRDWALISTEDVTDLVDGPVEPWHAYRQEIIAVNILTGAVKRLAHHRSRSLGADYYAQPRLSASWLGNIVGYASNFNQPGVVDAFAVLLDALAPPPDAPALPVTIRLGGKTYTGTVKETL